MPMSSDDQMTEQPDHLLPTTRRALLHRVAVAQAEGRTPSLVAGVVREGRLVWSGARSMIDGHAPDADVQYRIGSLTKTFVAVLVLRLRDEGLLDLADPLGRHLPGTPADDVTVAQLLAHSGGLAAETPAPWWERTDGALRPELGDLLEEESPLKHPAGRCHHYSNPGYALLGALVEKVRGEPWGEVLRREVLAPLGLDRTTLLPEHPHAGGFAVHPWADVMLPEPLTDTGLMAPAGQLWSTGADLARWAAFLAAGDDKVLSADTLAEMSRPAIGPADADWTSGYGLGLQLRRHEGRLLYGHTGSMPGFTAGLWVSAEDGLAAFALSNATGGANTPPPGRPVDRHHGRPRAPAARPLAPAHRGRPGAPRAHRPLVLGRRAQRPAAARRRRPGVDPGRRRPPGLPFPAPAGRQLARPGQLLRGRDSAGGAARRRDGQPPGRRLLRLHPRAVRTGRRRSRGFRPAGLAGVLSPCRGDGGGA